MLQPQRPVDLHQVQKSEIDIIRENLQSPFDICLYIHYFTPSATYSSELFSWLPNAVEYSSLWGSQVSVFISARASLEE